MANISIAQIKVLTGNPEKNFENIVKHINIAKEKGSTVVAFPEMCVGGYLIGDKYNDDEYCRWLMSFNERIRQQSKGIAVIYGNILLMEKTLDHRPNKDGRLRKFNAAYAWENGEPCQKIDFTINTMIPRNVQVKTLLPNYRFFDDERYFLSLKDLAIEEGNDLERYYKPFKIGNNRVGITLCEDLWCRDYRRNFESINPIKNLAKNQSDYIINLSASPWTHGKNQARDKAVKYINENCKKHYIINTPLIYVNNVGSQNNGKNIITFDGGSTAYNSNGDPILLLNSNFKEEHDVVSFNNTRLNTIVETDGNKRLSQKVFNREEKNIIEEKCNAILEGLKSIKDIINTNDNPKWVIGLSGGIDSSVVAALLVKAFGSENVTGVNMPTKYNSDKTKNAAKQLTNKLQIKYIEIPIEGILDSYKNVINEKIGVGASSLNEENEQARIRGSIILSSIAARLGAFYTNNGNKLETALGYATLYGDVNGAIAPLGDLTKEEVFELARYINKDEEIIPKTLIPNKLFIFDSDQIAPTAELKEDQKDPMRFGYHDAILNKVMDYKIKSINDIMKWYIEGSLEKNLDITNDLILRWGINNPEEFIKDIKWFFKLMQDNVFKRIQSPPNIVTSKNAFGYDLRESQLPYIESEETKKLTKIISNMKEYQTI